MKSRVDRINHFARPATNETEPAPRQRGPGRVLSAGEADFLSHVEDNKPGGTSRQETNLSARPSGATKLDFRPPMTLPRTENGGGEENCPSARGSLITEERSYRTRICFQLFVVKKQNWGFRPVIMVINLSGLSLFILRDGFNQVCFSGPETREWAATVGLENVYLHVPIAKDKEVSAVLVKRPELSVSPIAFRPQRDSRIFTKVT